MDLEEFRIDRGLSYTELAETIGVTQAKQARSYALGHSWPRSKQLQAIIKGTKGAVDLAAMHKRRLDFLRHEERSVA